MKFLKPFVAPLLNAIITLGILSNNLFDEYSSLKDFVTYGLIVLNCVGIISLIAILLNLKKVAIVTLFVNGVMLIPIGILLIYVANTYLDETDEELAQRLKRDDVSTDEAMYAFSAVKVLKQMNMMIIIGVLLLIFGLIVTSESMMGVQHIGLGLLISINSLYIKRFVSHGQSVVLYNDYLVVKQLPLSIKKHILFTEISDMTIDDKKLTVHYINNVTNKPGKIILHNRQFEDESIHQLYTLMEKRNTSGSFL